MMCSPSSTHLPDFRRSRADAMSAAASRRRGLWREVTCRTRSPSKSRVRLAAAPRRRRLAFFRGAAGWPDRQRRAAPRRRHDGRGRLVASLARALAELEEHLVLLHHAKLRARALLDRLEAGLEIANVRVERIVARLELRIRFLLRREMTVEFAHLQPPAFAEPHRVLQRH